MKGRNLKIYDALILVIILLIISVIAYPLYRSHVIGTNRAEAKLTLINLTGAMERHFAKYNTYESATISKDPNTDISDTNMTTGGWYLISITQQSDTDFTISAIPQDTQANDVKCGTLSITKFGEKQISGEGPIAGCWF